MPEVDCHLVSWCWSACVLLFRNTYTLACVSPHLLFEENMREEAYTQLLQAITSTFEHSDQQEFLATLMTKGLDYRKELLRLSRAMLGVPQGTILHSQLTRQMTADEVSHLDSMFQDSLLRSILLRLSVIAPISVEEQLLQERKSTLKELGTCLSTRKERTLDFSCFFGDYSTPLLPDLPSNPFGAKLVHEAIDRWIASVVRETHYPTMSRKTCSESTLKEAWVTGLWSTAIDRITQVDLEEVYVRHGVRIGGKSEMRQRWYSSQLTPRTYFAAGGKAYFQTRFAKSIFKNLCEFLEPCHSRNRVNPMRLRLDSSDYGFIYDLTSFSSNLHDHANFLQRLSQYCKGTMVNCYDGRLFEHEVDLGDIVHDLFLMHNYPEFEMSTSMGFELNSVHGIAGFLGIYGNITTAMFLHTAIVLQAVPPDQANIAGDDGIGIVNSENEKLLKEFIACVGLLQEDKVYRTYEDSCLCLKSTLCQRDNRLYMMQPLVCPNFEFLFYDKIGDPRYPDIANMSRKERKGAFASSITAFLNSCITRTTYLEHERLHTFLSSLYDITGFPKVGNVPQFGGKLSYFVPCITPFEPRSDPHEWTFQFHCTPFVEVPLRIGYTDAEEDEIDVKERFLHRRTKYLSYWEKLAKYMSQEEVVVLPLEDPIPFLLNEYRNPSPKLETWSQINACSS